jgi:hypothetical protein
VCVEASPPLLRAEAAAAAHTGTGGVFEVWERAGGGGEGEGTLDGQPPPLLPPRLTLLRVPTAAVSLRRASDRRPGAVGGGGAPVGGPSAQFVLLLNGERLEEVRLGTDAPGALVEGLAGAGVKVAGARRGGAV